MPYFDAVSISNVTDRHKSLLLFFSYSNENSDLAADLVKILSECQQEVPDYLANGGGGGGGMAAQGKILILNKFRHV